MEWDLNADLYRPNANAREKDTTAVLAAPVLKDMPSYFLLYNKSWEQDSRTWSMVFLGREVRSCKDDLLGTERRLFCNVSVWDP